MISVNSQGVAVVIRPPRLPPEQTPKTYIARTDFERFEDCLDCALMAEAYWEDNCGPDMGDWPGITPMSRTRIITYLEMVAVTHDAWLMFTRRTH